MKYDERRNKMAIKVSPWELKVLVKALQSYGADSPEAAEFPEEFWTFKKQLDDELYAINFMDEIQKPDDRGMLGPFPDIK